MSLGARSHSVDSWEPARNPTILHLHLAHLVSIRERREGEPVSELGWLFSRVIFLGPRERAQSYNLQQNPFIAQGKKIKKSPWPAGELKAIGNVSLSSACPVAVAWHACPGPSSCTAGPGRTPPKRWEWGHSTRAQSVPHGLPLSGPLGQQSGAPARAHVASTAQHSLAQGTGSVLQPHQSCWLDTVSRH